MTTTTPGKAGIYARISLDDELDEYQQRRALGVGRQIEDCIALSERKGWSVVKHYVDNNVSASKVKPRPEYQRLLADVRAGRIDGIICWDTDRLTRQPRELEDLIDLADAHGLTLASVGGEFDLSTPQGRFNARTKGNISRMETEQQSRRVKRKNLQNAEAGQPSGPVRYGWRRVVDFDDRGRRIGFHDEIDPERAAIVRQCAERLLKGESLRSMAIDLNAAGHRTIRGDLWRSNNLARLLMRPRNIGKLVYQGKPFGDGDWPSILDQNTYDRVMAALTNPTRRTTDNGGKRIHLLSGIARCGVDGCDGLVGVTRHHSGRSLYQCRKCWGSNRSQLPTDAHVETEMLAMLERPESLDVLLSGDADAAQKARDDIAASRAKLALAADQFSDDIIDGEQLARITAKLRSRISSAEASLDASLPANLPSGIAGPQAAQRWQALPLDSKRALISALAVVTIRPIGAGKRFDPALVTVEFSE